MSTPYAQIDAAVNALIVDHQKAGIDPTVAAYMIARAALLLVRAIRDGEKASSLAYKLGDELATADRG